MTRRPSLVIRRSQTMRNRQLHRALIPRKVIRSENLTMRRRQNGRNKIRANRLSVRFIILRFYKMLDKIYRNTCPFFLDTVFNLPNNVEVLMEVSSESNIDAGSSNEQNASGNENNNNARKLSFVRRLMRETMFFLQLFRMGWGVEIL